MEVFKVISIVPEKRTHQLRTISVESLLSLGEMMNEYDISHEDILVVVHPSRPTIDSVVGLMARLTAQRRPVVLPQEEPPHPEPSTAEEDVTCRRSPVRSDEEESAQQTIQTPVGKEKILAFGERTPGGKGLKPGHWIC